MANPAGTETSNVRKRQSAAAMAADLGFRLLLVTFVMAAGLTIGFFPRATDAPLTAGEQAELERYYAAAYEDARSAPDAEQDSAYVRIAESAAAANQVEEAIRIFVQAFGLRDKRVLDVGAGRGYLQDLVDDYTGLDISPTARRFFHKRFVQGSATHMPLQDDAFDAAWSIWVLEHVPNPEAALSEMRRVVRDGGVLLLAPAWDCTRWAADGYPVRPYSDFDWAGKITKASVPFATAARNLAKIPLRLVRYAHWKATGRPTTLRYTRLEPNYEDYWMPDSDAINSLDRYETALWFQSRGDECLNCEGLLGGWMQENEVLIIRVRKPGTPLAPP